MFRIEYAEGQVDAQTEKEDVASLMAKYDLLALPVVDARRKLLDRALSHIEPGKLPAADRDAVAAMRKSVADPRYDADVNLLGTADSLSHDREFQSRFVTFSEAGSSVATYPKPSRATSKR